MNNLHYCAAPAHCVAATIVISANQFTIECTLLDCLHWTSVHVSEGLSERVIIISNIHAGRYRGTKSLSISPYTYYVTSQKEVNKTASNVSVHHCDFCVKATKCWL